MWKDSREMWQNIEAVGSFYFIFTCIVLNENSVDVLVAQKVE